MKKYVFSVVIIGTILLSSIPLISFSQAQSVFPDRSQIVWGTGYWQTAASLNPWASNPAYGIAGMYETLFGYNGITNKIIPVIGTSYYWDPSNDCQCIVNLNSQAKWSDNQPITADDVVYSYELAMDNTSNFGPDMQTQLQDIIELNSTAVMFTTKPAYHHTGYLDVWLTTNVPIVPMHVWTVIMSHLEMNAPTNELDGINESLDSFSNDWFNPVFNTSWEVASGPYLPYYRSADDSIEIYKLNPTWWGKGIIDTDLPNTGGMPQVEYIGLNHYSNDDLQDSAFANGQIDYFGGYYGNIWNLMAGNPSIYSWYGQNFPYELGINSMVELVPNNQIFPFSCSWLRQTLAWDIDYASCSASAVSGYLTRAKQGFVDNTSAQLAGVYNASIQQNYGIPNINKTMALNILSIHATHNASGWWTNPSEANSFIGYPVAGQNGVFVQANTSYLIGDMNANDGDSFPIIDVSGWSDVETAMSIAAASFTTDLNISCREIGLDYGSYVSDFQDGNFSLGMSCSSPALNNNPVIFFNGYRGTYSPGNNYPYNRNTSRWIDQAYENAFQDFMVEVPGSAGYQHDASIMQYELATQIPSIPFYGNGFWYAYSNQYWTGWNYNSTQYQQITTVWDNTNYALRNREILNLSPANALSNPIDIVSIIEYITIGAVAALVIVVLLMQRRYVKKLDELSKST